MAAPFALAAVLRVREIALQQAERALTRALQDRDGVRRAVERIDREIGRTAAVRETGLQSGMRAAHLQISYLCVGDLRESRRQLQEQLGRLETVCAEHTRAYEEAYRAHELLQSIRTQAERAILRQEAASAQKLAEDLFAARRHREAAN